MHCKDGKQQSTQSDTETTSQNGSTIGISQKPFGTFEGKEIIEYTIKNKNGLELSVINYGGAVTHLMVPDKKGKLGDVVTGFANMEGFVQKGNPYFGALIGRYGNRINKGTFTLDGATYKLPGNEHGNSLHGGDKGYDKVFWNIEPLSASNSLKLTYKSVDGEQGYPGNLNITVLYSLTDDNEFKIDYKATTDKATPVNLTSHCYFNLSAGNDSTILNHKLFIAAPSFTDVNDQLIPTGNLVPVNNGAMDFNVSKRIGNDIDKVKGGYDHNWVLKRSGAGMEKVAQLEDTVSGRVMEVLTTEPGLQFYSGNFLDGTLQNTKGGAVYVKHGALCLETQHYPDSPNQPSFPSTILKPGDTYSHTTSYKFSTK